MDQSLENRIVEQVIASEQAKRTGGEEKRGDKSSLWSRCEMAVCGQRAARARALDVCADGRATGPEPTVRSFVRSDFGAEADSEYCRVESNVGV